MEPHGALPGPARLAEMFWNVFQVLLTLLTQLVA
jgi:hypothetical protein